MQESDNSSNIDAPAMAASAPGSRAEQSPSDAGHVGLEGPSGFGSHVSTEADAAFQSSPDGPQGFSEAAPLAAAPEPNAGDSAPAVASNQASGAAAALSQTAADLHSPHVPAALGGSAVAAHSDAAEAAQDAGVSSQTESMQAHA